MYIVTLEGARKELCGNKAHRLGLLIKYSIGPTPKFRVPDGFVLTFKVFEEWQKHEKLADFIKKDIENYLEKLDLRTPLIARSSANLEDSNLSFPGVFESIGDIVNEDRLFKAIDKVFGSVYSSKVKEYCSRASIDHKSLKMAIIVQEQISPSLSGVMFTDPKGNVVIEYSKEKDSVTSGKGQIKRFVLKNNETTNDPVLNRLRDVAMELMEIFGRPQDIEWALVGKEIYILQSRDVTKWPVIKKENSSNKPMILKGTPASPGIAKGRARIILDSQPVEEALSILDQGDILVGYVFPPEYLVLLKKVKAVVVKTDSILCHMAIVSRELGIPCVVGVDVEKIADGEEILVNGFDGTIRLNRALNLSKRTLYCMRSIKDYPEIKEIEQKFLKALDDMDPKALEKICKNTFKMIKEKYEQNEKDKAYSIYYLINKLLKEDSYKVLSKKYDNLSILLSKIDSNDVDDVNPKLIKVYRVLKRFINYRDETNKDIVKLLFNV